MSRQLHTISRSLQATFWVIPMIISQATFRPSNVKQVNCQVLKPIEISHLYRQKVNQEHLLCLCKT